MKAIVDSGGRLTVETFPDPKPGPDEALLAVRATALNRADLAQRAGRYAPPPGASEILGLEAAGVVVAGGGDDFPDGSTACALLTGGGYAELVALPRAMLMPVPSGWSWEQAAAFPEAFFTAYLNLFMEGELERGETVLVHAGASGVGTAAIMLAAAAGCRVVATAGSSEKVAACLRLGAEFAFNRHETDFLDELRECVPDGVDVILDVAGGSYLERNVEALRLEGRLVIIATMGGRSGPLDLRRLMTKRLTIRGSTLRSRPLEQKVHIKESLWRRFGAEFAANRIVPLIDSVYSADRAQEAHERMASDSNVGKIVLFIGEQQT